MAESDKERMKRENLRALSLIFGVASLIANIVFIVLIILDVYLPGFTELYDFASHRDTFLESKDFPTAVLLVLAWYTLWYFMAKGFIHFLSFCFPKMEKRIHVLLSFLYIVGLIVLSIFKIKSWDNMTVYFVLIPFIISLIWTEPIGGNRIGMSFLGLGVFLVILFLVFLINWLLKVAIFFAILAMLGLIGLVVLLIMFLVAGDGGPAGSIFVIIVGIED